MPDSSLGQSATWRRFVESLGITFTMFCDDHALSVGDGNDLAEIASDAILDAAEERADNPAVPR